jgi:hypothetical protein
MATPETEATGDGHGTLCLRAVLQPRGPAAALVLDDAQLATLHAPSKNPPVRVTVNGHTFAGRVARMRGETLIGFNRAVREACGVAPGDEIEATITLDVGRREVDVPTDLTIALDAEPTARAAFDALAYSHRKEFARWVAEAKKPETRGRRIEQMLAMLAKGETR